MRKVLKKSLALLLVLTLVFGAAPLAGLELSELNLFGTKAEAAEENIKYGYYNGHAYAVIDSPMKWDDAKNYCESLGGHLVTITSKEEDDFVFSLIKSFSPSYDFAIGITDKNKEGDWSTWITGEKVVYSNWGENEPDNLSGDQCIGVMTNGVRSGGSYYCTAGQWDDNGDGLYRFICEWEYEEEYNKINKLIEAADKVSICIKSKVNNGDYTEVSGAKVSLYFGNSEILSKYSDENGNVVFSKSEIMSHCEVPLYNITVHAEKNVGNHMYLLSDYNYGEIKLSDINNNTTIYLDNKQLRVDLSLAYELTLGLFVDIESECMDFMSKLYEMTNGKINIEHIAWKEYLFGIGVTNSGCNILAYYDYEYSASDPLGFWKGGHIFMSETYSGGFSAEVLCHEALHYLIGVRDEYCCGYRVKNNSYDLDFNCDGSINDITPYDVYWIDDGVTVKGAQKISDKKYILKYIDQNSDDIKGRINDQNVNKNLEEIKNGDFYSITDSDILDSVAKNSYLLVASECIDDNGTYFRETGNGYGYFSKPITTSFGIMESDYENLWISTEEMYSYLNGYDYNKKEDNAELYTAQYYDEKQGKSVTTALDNFLNNKINDAGYGNTSDESIAHAKQIRDCTNDKVVESDNNLNVLNGFTNTNIPVCGLQFERSDNGVIITSDRTSDISFYVFYSNGENQIMTFDDQENTSQIIIESQLTDIERIVVCDNLLQTYNEYCVETFSNEVSDGSYVSSLMTITLDSENKEDLILLSDDVIYTNESYSSIMPSFTVFESKGCDNITAQFTKAVPFDLNIDFTSIQAFKIEGNEYTAVKTWSSSGEHNSKYISFDYCGEGKYVLMAKPSTEVVYSSIRELSVNMNENDFEKSVKVSFSDDNDKATIAAYNIYYSNQHITDTTSSNIHHVTVMPGKSEYSIFMTQDYGTVYFAVEVIGCDGGRSELSEELEFELSPKDEDNDGIPDYWINWYPILSDLEDIAGTDSDEDGLTNLQEYKNGTNPLNPDTDGDNVYDCIEIWNGLNPLEPMTDGKTDDYTVIYGIPDVRVDASSFVVSETEVTCTISNSADGKAMRTLIYLYVGDELVDAATVNLDANSSVNYSFSKEHLVDGMRIVLDEDRITRDSDYSNNEFVFVPASGITSTVSEITIVKNNSVQLEYVMTPENASKIIEWNSSDESIVTVSDDGIARGIKIGTATVSATISNGSSCTYEILVEPISGAGLTDFDCELINNNTEVQIVGYVGSNANVSIPDHISEYPVTSVAEGAFRNEIIESINIPSTVSAIQPKAFMCSEKFKTVTVDPLNSSYRSDDGVLFNIDRTEIVVYPPAKENAEYVIPDATLTVAPYAFYKAQNLLSVDLNKVQTISEYAFDYSALTSVTIPEQVTTIGKSVFYNCANLTDVCFNAINCVCEYSPTLFLNNFLNKTRHVFSENITSVELGKNVQFIDNGIFGLVSVSELNIPESVTAIKKYAFKKALNLTDIYYDGSARMWNCIELGSNSGLTSATMHYGKFTATFINDGETLSQIDYKPGDTIQIPNGLPEKKYYTFAGWTPAVPETMPECDTDFVAVWELSETTRTVEYYVDGNLYWSDYRYAGEDIIVPETPTKEGYTFVKWSPDIAEIMPDENLTYEAIWDINVHQVTFNVDGETYHSYECAYSDAVTIPDSPSKEGYNFVGWTPAVPETMPDTDLEFIAVFEVITYTATFTVGETVVGIGEFTVEDTELDISVVEQREGYEYVCDDYVISANDITVNGNYVPIVYNAIFVADGKTVSSIQFDIENMTVNEPDVPSKAGYNGSWESYEIQLADFTVNAVYTPITYVATFMKDGEIIGTDEFTVEDSSLDYPVVAEKEYYSWVWDEHEIVAGNITVSGKYVPISYTITFIADEKTVGTAQFNVENQTISEPDIPDKVGYTGAWEKYEMQLTDFTVKAIYTPIIYTATFTNNGEYIGEDKFTIEDESLDYPDIRYKNYYNWVWESHKIEARDITVDGKYVPIVYTIKFVSNGKVVKTQTFTVETSDSVVAPNTSLPAKKGYTVGWEEYKGKICNLTVNEIYKPISYKLSFCYEDKVVATRWYTIEDTVDQISLPALPNESGYMFEWPDFELEYKDSYVYAVKTPIEYTARFIADGELVEAQTFTVETEKLNEPPIPQKPGYIAGWGYYEIKAKDIDINAKYSLPNVFLPSVYTVDINDSFLLLPSDNFDSIEKVWSSSDSSVATVSRGGRVTAVGKGECKITVTCFGKDSMGNDIQATGHTIVKVKDNPKSGDFKQNFRERFNEFFEITLHDLLYNFREFMILLLRSAY